MAAYLSLGRLIIVLKWILRIGGLWIPRNHNSIFTRFYNVYSWCFIFIFSIAFTAFMCANLLFLNDIAQVSEMLFMSMTEFALVLKIINFYVNNRRLQYMLVRIQALRMANADEETIMTNRLDFLIRQTTTYYICANVSLHASAMNSAFGGRDKLIYSGYYPGVDWQNNAVAYWCIFGYQYIGMIFTTQINLAIDSYFCIIMYLLSGQIIIFGNRLAMMGKQNDGEMSSIQQRTMLIEHVKMYNGMVEFIQDLQHCLWWSFSGQILSSAIAVGSIVNEVLRGTTIESTFTYISNIAGVVAFVLQIFLICYNGQCVLSECEELPKRIYESNWIDMINTKRYGDYGALVLIFVERLRGNGQILIGKLFPLSLSTFKSIMSIAYRLLALLK